jgi:outer membrane protein assembly factor BamA
LGGDDTLRTYPYYSVAGNQVAYGSAELRFPVADVLLFRAIPFTVRGFLFGDVASAKFSDSRFAGRDEYSYGFGAQVWLFMPMNFEWARTKFEPNKWRFNFRIGLNF